MMNPMTTGRSQLVADKTIFGWCLALAVLLLTGACSSKVCGGALILCRTIRGDQCEQVPGCIPGAACVMVETTKQVPCAASIREADCPSPMCTWVAGACMDVCSTKTDQDACNVTSNIDPSNWGCSWSQCHGTPTKKYCDQYPVNACPAELGCAVEQNTAL